MILALIFYLMAVPTGYVIGDVFATVYFDSKKPGIVAVLAAACPPMATLMAVLIMYKVLTK